MLIATGAYRMTRQCRLVLEAVRASGKHLTASEIYDIVRREKPRISLGTVYRNLDKLVRWGRIARFDSGENRWRFDADVSGHHHIRCARCGKLDDLVRFDTKPLARRAANKSGYAVLEVKLDLTGICPECRTRSGRINHIKRSRFHA
jgi:Fur family ferric uptake transcriptional regulator